MADFIWRGDAQVFEQIRDWVIGGAAVGDSFTVTINNKAVTYTLTQEDIDAATGSQTNNSVAMRGIYAELVAAAETIGEFGEMSYSLETDENNADEVTAVRVTGRDDGMPFDATLTSAPASHTVQVTVSQQGSAGQNEIQVLSLGTPTGGTFTITFSGQTTGAIAYNASAATVDTALEALSNIGVGDVTVTGSAGGPWTVEFTGALANANQPTMSIDGSSLTGGTTSRNRIESLYNWLPQGQTEATFPQLTLTRTGTVSGGTFTITNDTLGFTTASLNYNATWLEIRAALEAATSLTEFYVLVDGEDEDTAPDETIDTASSLSFFRLIPDTTSPRTDDTWSVDDSAITGGGTLACSETTGYSTNGTGVVFEYRLRVGIGGTWTSWLACDATIEQIQTALEALPEIGTGNVQVTAADGTGAFGIQSMGVRIEYIGDLAGQDVDALEFEEDSGFMSSFIRLEPDVGAVVAAVNPRVTTTQNGAPTQNEIQVVTLTPTPTGGTFTLSFDPGGGAETTGNIAYNASAATVQTALEGLATPVPGDVIVTGSAGGPWTVEFDVNFGDMNVNLMTGNGSLLTGGSQTFTESDIQEPAGPNWFDLADNWVGAAIPNNSSTIYLRNSSVSIKWGLSNADINPSRFVKDASYTGEVGLPKWNAEGGYYEYRDTELRLGTDGVGPSSMTFELGVGDGEGSALVRLNCGDKESHVTIYRTGTSTETNAPAFNFVGTHASNTLNVVRGDAAVGFFPGEVATLATLQISFVDSVESDATVTIGEDVTLGDIQKTGGTLNLHCAADSLEQLAGVTNVYGSGDITVLDITGGSVNSNTTGKLGHYGSISGVTQANPAVVSSTAHGLTTGDKVRIAGVVGMTELNQNEYTIEVVNANSFKLVGINSSGYGAWSAGGTWGKIESVVVAGDALLNFSQSNAARQVAVAIDLYGDESTVKDDGKRVTTTTYLTGEFAIHFHRTTRDENLGLDYILVRRS